MSVGHIVALLFLCFVVLAAALKPGEKGSIAFVVLGGTRSHARAALETVNVLANRGHHVSFASFDDNLNWIQGYNFSTISLGPLPNEVASEEIRKKLSEHEFTVGEDIFSKTEAIVYQFRNYFLRFYRPAYEQLSRVFAVEKPDLILCDIFAEACIDYAYTNKIPFVVSSFVIGFFTSQNYAPLVSVLPPIEQMSFYQRFENTILRFAAAMLKLVPMAKDIDAIKVAVGVEPDSGPASKFKSNTIIVTSFFPFMLPQPLNPNVHVVGPVLTKDYEQVIVGSELDKWLSQHADKPLVYIAFGTYVTINSRYASIILEIIQRSPHIHFLWAIREENSFLPTTLPENLFVDKWFPQIAILKIVRNRGGIFMSHGGIESIHESLHIGVPMLVFPTLGDQTANGLRLSQLGVGIVVRRTDTTDTVIDGLNYLLNSTKVQENLNKLSLIAEYGSHRKELAADAIEIEMYVGHDHLITGETIVGPFIAHGWDQWSLVFGVVFFISYAVYRLLYALLCSRSSAKQKSD